MCTNTIVFDGKKMNTKKTELFSREYPISIFPDYLKNKKKIPEPSLAPFEDYLDDCKEITISLNDARHKKIIEQFRKELKNKGFI